MKNILWISYLALVVVILLTQTIIVKPTTFDQFLTLLTQTIEILSPIGVFVLSSLGLMQWKEEITFRGRNKLSEEIALSLLEFKNAINEIRSNWDKGYLPEAKWAKEISEEEELFSAPIETLIFVFSDHGKNKLNSRIDFSDRKKDDLAQKLQIAGILWNKPGIEISADQLFDLYFDMLNAISRIRIEQGVEKWTFRGKEIENNRDLSLILHFTFRTKNKTVDELNAFFKKEFDLRSKIILENISEYLY